MSSHQRFPVDGLLAAEGLVPRVVSNHGLQIRVLRIGPAEARALLAANTDNRTLRKGRVKVYARLQAEGQWQLTHQGLAFSADGVGLDLQHRMHAVIESGVEIEIMVVEGLPSKSFEAIDQHERRSMSDALKLRRDLVEEAKVLLMAAGGEDANRPLPRMVEEAAMVISDASSQLNAACGTKRAVFSSAAMRVAACLVMTETPDRGADVIAMYRSLVLMHTEAWTPVMHAFGRQVAGGKLDTVSSAGRIDVLIRGMKLFDPARTYVSRIQVNGDSAQMIRPRIRNMLGLESA